MVDALVSTVIQQLATIIQMEVDQEVRLVVGMRKDVEKLSHTFMKIRAVLKDAEKRQIMDDSVRQIVHQGVVVDDDDDDAHMKVCPSNLFSPYFCFKQIGLRRDIGHRIKEINERVDDIANLQEKFRFNGETAKNEIIDEPIGSLESSSLVDVSEVFGRDSDENFIVSKLLSKGSSSSTTQQGEEIMVSDHHHHHQVPMIISTVGMAGMGKTTLAQLAFSDDRVENHFNKRMWVHVSQPFDRVKVTLRIIEEIGGGDANNIVTTTTTTHVGHHHDNAWESLHRQLTSSVEGKNFLLVLDDVWNEDRNLWDPFWLSLKCGSPGSRVIVTTRNENVAIMMGTVYVHRLEILSDENCWSVLRHYAAVAGRQEEEEERDQLKEIGMELAKKCKGLPLSAKTLGSLLRFKKSKQDWQDVLESDVWTVVSTADPKAILPTLLLSYSFPKILVKREWIAQGFLSDDSIAAASSRGDLDKVADEYFNNLVVRSLFQKDIQSKKGRSYIMHDLVHDFAKSLVENECFTFTAEDTINVQEPSCSRARHLSLVVVVEEKCMNIPSFTYKAKSLRTLTIYGGQIPRVSFDLFLRLTCLRTLDLADSYLEELPKEIGKLIHLRNLNLSTARFRELPKSVTSLYNLQILVLQECSNLCKLPEGIGGLVNLIDLDLSEWNVANYVTYRKELGD
ncbi:putative disease resistance protein RGA3 [Telopea speciosissima]|uniref:putative disease resistance protein RGA3 n=1 Tax=Telopea speciosissima TaxID=54955 RepID=UPI001CC4C3FD|nr:putative disease resistance protein RGA3 [Telopea speciosissima]